MDRTGSGPDWFDRVPKVELHLHLEGAIPIAALWELIANYGGDPSVESIDALQDRFAYRDFPHFIDTWIWKNRFLRSYDDFTFIAEAVAQDLVAQNIRYAEAFFSPSDFSRHGLETQRLAEAVRTGLSRVAGVEIALIADVVRDSAPGIAARTTEEVGELTGLGVIGIGLGGSEQKYPPERFVGVFERARALGLHTTAHAGEAAGPESVWGAIRELHVERIGHGTRAQEDPALLDHLAKTGLPIEMCPVSNVRTAVVPSLGLHPIRRYFERGLRVTVNTDDPKMFNTTLAGEYRQLASCLGFSQDECRELILAGIRSSWLPEPRKAQLTSSFLADPGWTS